MNTELYGLTVAPDHVEKLEVYHALLLKWQKAINIVSPKTLGEAWHRHFIDSAQISQYISKDIKTYADLGCGGGFPGLVLAIMRPELDVHLVESDERKCQFMRTVARETQAKNVTVHTKRIENAIDDVTPDFISARALASLEQLFSYCLPWAQDNADLQFCFMKGARADEELKEAEKRFIFEYRSVDSLTDAAAQLLLIEKLVCV